MKIVTPLPKVVRRKIATDLSAWDPRIGGPVQEIRVDAPSRVALLTEELPVRPVVGRILHLRWSKGLNPKTGERHWNVDPVGADDWALVRNLEMELEHHFDDPLEAV